MSQPILPVRTSHFCNTLGLPPRRRLTILYQYMMGSLRKLANRVPRLEGLRLDVIASPPTLAGDAVR